jgi:hypothetical protein
MGMENRPSGAIEPEQAAKARTLVVFCVELDAAQLQPAFDVLAMRGFEIAVIERQDVRAPALAEHAQRHGADALYVLARITEAPESTVGPLAAALKAAGVAADHISALAIDWRDPMALVEHVAALAGASRTTDAPILRTTTTAPPAGRRASTGPQRSIALVSPRTETGPQRPVAPARKQITGPYGTVPPPPAVAVPKEAGKPRTLAVKVELPEPVDATPEPAPSAPAIEPAAAAIQPAFAPVASAPVLAVSEAAVSEPIAVSIEPVEDASEPIAAAVEPVVAPMPASEPLFPAPRPLLPAAPDISEADEPRRSRLHTVTAALRPLAEITGSRSRGAIRWIASTRARLYTAYGTAMATVLLLAIAGSRDDDATPTDQDASAPAVAKAVDPPAPSQSLAGANDKNAAAANDTAALIAKARSRKQLGVHEGIVFAPVHAQKRKFAAAKQLCEGLNAGALKGWRMPTLSELHVLAVARVIDRGVYWSGTEEGAFGTHALIWSEKKSAAIPITKAWNGARALCVLDDGASR